jgi:Spy/CpxP family protein refolding chaperone
VSAARTTVIAVIVLAVTFITGLVAGFGIGRFAHFPRGAHGPMPQIAANMMLNRLDHHLDLTDAQEKQIRAIFERRHSRMAEEIASTNAEIERVLNPEQREKFKKLRMHLRGRR